jgi:hypothetical protein
VQGVRVLRRLPEDAAVEGLGLVEAAGLVVLDGQGEALADGEHEAPRVRDAIVIQGPW